MRLFSRAFVFDDGWKRSVFVSVDCGMIDQLLKIEVSYGGRILLPLFPSITLCLHIWFLWIFLG